MLVAPVLWEKGRDTAHATAAWAGRRSAHAPWGHTARRPVRRTAKISNESPIEWIQLTFRITSKQRFAAYRARGAAQPLLLAGDPSAVLDVEDHWVLEHKTFVRDSKQATVSMPRGARWRLVGQLALASPGGA